MSADLLQAISLIATPTELAVIILATALGIVLGALPGIGSTVAVAMCVPFTLGMDQVPAITLLVGVYCGSVYGGSISAILINSPGTPQSACTCFDGFPMAKAGKAGEALGWATMASVAGGLVSAIVLIFLTPQLAAFAVRFGPVETAALLLLGLTCIVTVSRENTGKGLIAGLIGLFIASVGSDPVTGEQRFTFGQVQLGAGFDLLAVVVGIFAVAEVLSRVAERMNASQMLFDFKGIVLPRLHEWSGRMVGLFKSVGIGCVIGVLPGTGAATAAFISYAEAKRSSPRGANFGKGEPDGLIASEGANNAVTGGALVPTLALGIPGDAITAVMLATLTLKGITPGIRLMQDHGDLVSAIFIAFLIINLIMLPLAMGISRVAAPLLRTREQVMLTLIIILCATGVFLGRGNVFDLWTMLAAGVIGFAMRQFRFPVAPLVIGMVLGPNFELALRQSMLVTRGDPARLLNHPIALTLIVIVIAIFLIPALKTLRKTLRRRSVAA